VEARLELAKSYWRLTALIIFFTGYLITLRHPPATRSELYPGSGEWRNQAGGPHQKWTLQGKSTFCENLDIVHFWWLVDTSAPPPGLMIRANLLIFKIGIFTHWYKLVE
jgi:hypothetical protein